MTAAQAAAKARGEPIDLSKKKKNPTGKQRGNIANLRRGKQPGPGTATGTATPVTEITESGRTTPVDEDEEEDDTPVPPMEAPVPPADGIPRKEIITCEFTRLREGEEEAEDRSYAYCSAVVTAGEEVL